MAQRVQNGQSRAKAQAENSRRRKKRRRGRRTLHFTLLILFLLASGAVLSLTVFFKIEEVRVTGTDKYSPDEVAAASGIQKEDNLLRIDKEAVTEQIMSRFPYVESVEVRRRLPPAVEINITQAKPEAAIPQGDQVALITRQGKVLERGVLLVPDDIPLVKGINVTGVAPGGYLDEKESEKLGMLRYLLEAMEQTDFQDITNVDLTDPLNIRIMYENRILLELGTEARLDYKLIGIKDVLARLGPGESGTLDAADAAYKSRWYFRPSTSVPDYGAGQPDAGSEHTEADVESDPFPDIDNEQETV